MKNEARRSSCFRRNSLIEIVSNKNNERQREGTENPKAFKTQRKLQKVVMDSVNALICATSTTDQKCWGWVFLSSPQRQGGALGRERGALSCLKLPRRARQRAKDGRVIHPPGIRFIVCLPTWLRKRWWVITNNPSALSCHSQTTFKVLPGFPLRSNAYLKTCKRME